MCRPREGTGGLDPPGKLPVAISFLRNTDTDPPREAIGPKHSNCFLREVHKALCEICWWLKFRALLTKVPGSLHVHGIWTLTRLRFACDWLQSLKQFFINVTYHIALKQSHQSKTSYKYMVWHIDEKLFYGLEPVYLAGCLTNEFQNLMSSGHNVYWLQINHVH